jgi:Protein of unknown function (DUF3618)
VPERSPEEVQREIEQARDALAEAVDQLTYRTNPKRLADETKQTLIAKAQSPAGKAVIAGVGVLFVLVVVRGIRGKKKDKD